MKTILPSKYMVYRFLPLLLIFFLFSCTTPQTTTQSFQNNTVPKELGKPALLNLNGFYFLYTYPVSTFISNDKVFVPLYRFAALLDVFKTFEYKDGILYGIPISAVLARGDIEVSLDNHSKITITNTKTGQTITPSYSGQNIWQQVEESLYGVYVPLDIFKDAFGINVTYNSYTDTYNIVDTQSNFTKDLPIDELVYTVQPTPVIYPIKVNLEVTNKPTLYEYSEFKLTLEIKAPDDFTGKAEDISVALISLYDSASSKFAGNTKIKPFTCQADTQKNVFICTEVFTPDLAISPLRHVFSRIGIRIK